MIIIIIIKNKHNFQYYLIMNYFTLHFKEDKIEKLYNEKSWQKQS